MTTGGCRATEDTGGQRLRSYRLDELEKTVEELDGRLKEVEGELPTMKLVRNWVIGGIVGLLSVVGMAVVVLVLR